MPAVATYETTLSIPRSVEDTFAFVSDFRHAVDWDPRTFAAEKTTDGPIGVGTRFMLTGGMMSEELVRRLHIPRALAAMPLPYDVVEFDAPHKLVLEGESRVFSYRDQLEFSADGTNTTLRYSAKLELKGFLAIGDPLLRPIFKRIGDAATRGIPAAVERNA